MPPRWAEFVFRGLKTPRWVNFADPRPKGDDAEPPVKPAAHPLCSINNVSLAPGVLQPLFSAAMPLSPADPSPLLSYSPPVLSKTVSRTTQSETTSYAINAAPSAYGHCWADNITPCLELNAANVTVGYDAFVWEHSAALQNAPASGCSFTAPDDRSDATTGRAWSPEGLTRAALNDHALTYWQSGLYFTNFALSDYLAETNNGRVVYHTRRIWPGALHDRNGNQLAFTYGGAKSMQRAASWTPGNAPDASVAPVRPVARVANSRIDAELHSVRSAGGLIVALTNVVAGVPRRTAAFAYSSRKIFDPPGEINDFIIALLERVTLPDGSSVRYEYTDYIPPDAHLQSVFRLPLLSAVITAYDTTTIHYAEFSWFGPDEAQSYQPGRVTLIANNGASTQIYERVGTPEFHYFGGSVKTRTITTTGTHNLKEYDVYADRATRQWLGVEIANTLDNRPQFSYQYDPLRLLPVALAGHDGLGASATNAFFYDRFDNLTGHTDALGNQTRRVFAPNGMDLLETTDARGTLTTNAYDARGNLVLSVEDAGVYVAPEYMAVTTSYQIAPGVTTNVVELFPTNWVETAGLARATRAEYNIAGQPIKTIDALGRVTRNFYSPNRIAEPVASYGGEPSASSAGFLVATRDALDRVTTYSYDALGRQTVVNSPGNSPAARYVITNYYDIMDRATATWFPDGTHLSNVYDAAGYLIMTRDRAGRWTTNYYDAAGHLVRAVFPNGDTVEKSFCGDMVTALTDGRGNVTRYYYDHEQLVGVEFPDGTKRAAGFDNLNRQLWAVDERGVTVTNVYDALGRLVFAGYTAFDAGCAARDCTQPPAFGLDGFTRDLSEVYPAESLHYTTAYTYDESGNVTSYTDWLGAASNSYDALNRLQSIAEETTKSPSHEEESVAAIGDRGTVAAASCRLDEHDATRNHDGSATSQSAASQVSRAKDQGSNHVKRQTSNVECHWSFSYDLANNRTARMCRTSNVECLTSYAYDPLNRLTSLSASAPSANVATAVPSHGSHGSAVPAALAPLISTSYAYNPNGKLSAMTVASASAPRFSKSLSYDAENRLSQIAVTNALNQALWSSAYAYNRAQQITQITEQAFFTAAAAAIADRGKVAAASCRLDDPGNAVHLSGITVAPAPTVAAIADRGSPADAGRTNVKRPTSNVSPDSIKYQVSQPVQRPTSNVHAPQASSFKDQVSTTAFAYDARDQLTNELIRYPASSIWNHFRYDHAHNRTFACRSTGGPPVAASAFSYFSANKLEAISSGAGTADDDLDGLTLEDELRHGTDPANPDTDSDGLTDGDEVHIYNTNPWNADSDGDNMRDSDDARPLRPDGGIWFGASDEPWPRHFWLESTSLPVRAAPTNAASHLYYYDLAGNLVSNVVNGAWTRFYYNAQNKLTKIVGSGFAYEFMYDSRNRRAGVKKNNQDWRWDIHDGNVCIAQVENGTISKFFVRGIGTAEGTGDIVAEVEELRITIYDLRFGGEETTKAPRLQGRTVAAIGDCGGAATAASSPFPKGGRGISNQEARDAEPEGQTGRDQASGIASATHLYIANHRGDTVLVVAESGAVESHLQYDAFGNVTARGGSFTPSYTCSTKEHLPGANLYAYAYRVYDPHAGRWTQRDPIDYQDSVNLYQFCGNNGVNLTDPDGRQNYLTLTDPEYAYNWALTDREWRFAGNEVNRRMTLMVGGTVTIAAGAGVVLVYGPAAIAGVKAANAFLNAALFGEVAAGASQPVALMIFNGGQAVFGSLYVGGSVLAGGAYAVQYPQTYAVLCDLGPYVGTIAKDLVPDGPSISGAVQELLDRQDGTPR